MRSRWTLALAAAALLTGGQAPYAGGYAPPGGAADPSFHIEQASRAVVECGGRPIELDGSHTSTQLTGYCPYVRVAGEHNDVTIPVPPGATIEITAPHNDVTWRQTRPGPPPRLVALAPSNSFHPD